MKQITASSTVMLLFVSPKTASHSTSQLSQKLKTTYKASTSKVRQPRRSESGVTLRRPQTNGQMGSFDFKGI